jgi:hypothetical protein
MMDSTVEAVSAISKANQELLASKDEGFTSKCFFTVHPFFFLAKKQQIILFSSSSFHLAHVSILFLWDRKEDTCDTNATAGFPGESAEILE